MIEVLVSLLMFLMIGALAVWLVNMLPLPPPFHALAQILVVIVLLLVLLGYAGPSFRLGTWR
jgi:hypothetical protein